MVSDTPNVVSLDYPVYEIIRLGFHRERHGWKREGPSWSSQIHLQIRWCVYSSQIWSCTIWSFQVIAGKSTSSLRPRTYLYHLTPKAGSLLVHQPVLLDTLQMLRSYYGFPLEFLVCTMFSSDLSRTLPKLSNTFTMSFMCYCLRQHVYGE